jgi:predicted Mrr-cat superfamily restriction endonuclease
MIGWCDVGDLAQYQNQEEIEQVAEEEDCNNLAAPCLWKFYHEIQIGDLVILSTGDGGRRRAVMEVTGNYEYVEQENQIEPRVYAHQRKASPISINPDALWDEAEGMETGIGQTIYHTLIRCTKQVIVEE